MNLPLRNSYTIRVDSPDGAVFVHCIESAPANLEEVQISIGKTGSSVRAWADALAQMITASLRSSTLEDILVRLSSISTDKSVLNSRLVKVRSGPDAVFQALMLYKGIHNSSATIYRPPAMSVPAVW